ncbi:hypothetical protein ACFFKH_02585 [Micromonospora marina]|uniref:NUDIX hydrolase n=1 Tax=Micromonospora marina TaxID=307120 RepID=A0A1C4U5C3_9ACTN|nr:hypothetical protein [Micromonospora marina]SCE66846.1 hypothetical protein GA0070215_101250 [Micromonospora marina]
MEQRRRRARRAPGDTVVREFAEETGLTVAPGAIRAAIAGVAVLEKVTGLSMADVAAWATGRRVT